MFHMIGKPFFNALREAAERRVGCEHPCIVAIERAAVEGGAEATAEAQAALAALDPDMLGKLMADAHKVLRESPVSILGAWPGGVRH